MENLEFKGTKGKWYLQNYTDAYTNIIRVKTDTHDGIYLGSSSQNPSPEYRANAKLIAAAPDLLEAVQSLLKWSAHFPEAMNENILIAKDAINKALGD